MNSSDKMTSAVSSDKGDEEKGYRVVDRRRVTEEPKQWSEAKFAALVDRISAEGIGDEPPGPGSISCEEGVAVLRDAKNVVVAVMSQETMEAIRKEGEAEGRFVPEFAAANGLYNGVFVDGEMIDTYTATPKQVEKLVTAHPEILERYDAEQKKHRDMEEAAELTLGGRTDNGDPPPRNRREKKAAAKKEKALKKKLAKTTLNIAAAPTEDKGGPLDPLEFLSLIAENMNLACEENSALRKRVVTGEGMAADELQMAVQLAYTLGFLDAYGPKDPERKMVIVEIANQYRKQLHFHTRDGAPVQPKESNLVEARPTIIPATSLVTLR